VLPTAGLKGVWKTKVFPGYLGITIQDGPLYSMDRPNSEEGKGMERIVSWMRVQEWRCGVFPFGVRGHPLAFNSQTGENIGVRDHHQVTPSERNPRQASYGRSRKRETPLLWMPMENLFLST
jgi:hypothetical protein